MMSHHLLLSLPTSMSCARHCPAQTLVQPPGLHSLHCPVCHHCRPCGALFALLSLPYPQVSLLLSHVWTSPFFHSGSSIPYHCCSPTLHGTPTLLAPICGFDLIEFSNQCFCQLCNFRIGQVWVRFISAKSVMVKNCL